MAEEHELEAFKESGEIFPGFEVEESTLAPPEFHNLDNVTFKRLFGRYVDKNSLSGLWAEYKKDKSTLPQELQPVVKQIEQEQKDLLAKITDLSPEAQEIIDRNKNKLLTLSTMSSKIPTGALLGIDDVVIGKDKESGDEIVKNLSNKVYLGMVANDCDFEITTFLKGIGYYKEFNSFVKQYSGLGFSPVSGYKQGINYVREIFDLPEPNRCSIYHFSPDTVGDLLKTMNNDEFAEYLENMGMEKEFDAWMKDVLQREAPRDMTKDEWFNIARRKMGIPEEEIVSREQLEQDTATKNILEAVEILNIVKPGYVPNIDLEKAYIKSNEIPMGTVEQLRPPEPEPEPEPPEPAEEPPPPEPEIRILAPKEIIQTTLIPVEPKEPEPPAEPVEMTGSVYPHGDPID